MLVGLNCFMVDDMALAIVILDLFVCLVDNCAILLLIHCLFRFVVNLLIFGLIHYTNDVILGCTNISYLLLFGGVSNDFSSLSVLLNLVSIFLVNFFSNLSVVLLLIFPFCSLGFCLRKSISPCLSFRLCFLLGSDKFLLFSQLVQFQFFFGFPPLLEKL